MMKEEEAQCKMGVCYINIRKLLNEYIVSIRTSFLEIAFWRTADYIMAATSVYTASIIYMLKPQLPRHETPSA